jgi:hypothetical protein
MFASTHLAAHKTNFSGVDIINSCNGNFINTSSCLMTICAGRHVLRRSTLSLVQGIPGVETVLCVVGDSRLDVHNSVFDRNLARPLAVFSKAHLLLNASTISNNSVKGSGGGMLIEGGANVTMMGRSRVYGNRAVYLELCEGSGYCHYPEGNAYGGGLFARYHAKLTIDGNSSVSGNTAEDDGGGLAVHHNASVIITGSSSVSGNHARVSGGGLSAGLPL